MSARARPATRDEIPALATALTAAFRDDPVHQWIFPDPRTRPYRHPRFFAALLKHFFRHGQVFTTDDHAGAAMWECPRSQPAGLLESLEMALRVAPSLGWDGLRVGRGMEQFPKLHPREPHWYLAVLGAEPRRQRSGVGRALLRIVLERCDSDGVAAYLEASRIENVSYYERFGFEVVAPVQIGGGPTVWRMLRQPRRGTV